MFLDPIDFASMYKAHKNATDFKTKSAEDWDAKAADMAPRVINSPYVDDFISRMSLEPHDTVLDIGCGPGTLALALAQKVKKVIAIDYSKQMLEQLQIHAAREGIENIEALHVSWEDDWSSLPQVDIAVASRSMEVGCMHSALEKMNHHARKACYLTYKVGGSYVDMEILDFIGKSIIPKPDYWYIPLILYQKGYLPRVDYAAASRCKALMSSSPHCAGASARWMMSKSAKPATTMTKSSPKPHVPPNPSTGRLFRGKRGCSLSVFCATCRLGYNHLIL